jgi:ABC-type transport system involved in multi-copper enzyme maturation permease subunit
MMLYYKAWLESRTRFCLSAITLAGLCVLFVLCQRETLTSFTDEPVSYIGYIWRAIYKGYLRELFVLMVLLLGMGGLMREKAHGTACFTLAIPASRLRLVAARALVGFGEIAILSFVPAMVTPALSTFVHRSYPLSQALQFGLLWTVGGVLIFGLGFIASAIFSGEYTAPVAAFIGPLPWLSLAILLILASSLVALSVRIAQQQNF